MIFRIYAFETDCIRATLRARTKFSAQNKKMQ